MPWESKTVEELRKEFIEAQKSAHNRADLFSYLQNSSI